MILSKPPHSIYSNTVAKAQLHSHDRPLPSVLTGMILIKQAIFYTYKYTYNIYDIKPDLIAVKLCDLIPTRPIPTGCSRTAPELVYFILKVTRRARISCHIAVVALIYFDRCKKALPKNAIGDQGNVYYMINNHTTILILSCY
jgi:hypothetical protein